MACGPQQQWCGQTEEPSRLAETNVRYWHLADMPAHPRMSAIGGKADIRERRTDVAE